MLIERALAERRTTAELTLSPENLGQVQVQIRLDDNGALNAVLIASQNTTASLLGEEAAQLREALEACGLNVGELDVRAQADSRGDDRQAHPDAGATSAGSIAAPDGRAEDTDLDTAQKLIRARISGGNNLDLLA